MDRRNIEDCKEEDDVMNDADVDDDHDADFMKDANNDCDELFHLQG